jgi:L-ribulose-5-phosphate 3-epimerase
MMDRRKFIEKSVAAGAAGLVAQGMGTVASAAERTGNAPGPVRISGPVKDDISLAQWALVDEIREGKWTTLDFPRVAREDFGLNGIEFVNTLFAVPHQDYLNQLKANADAFGVTMVLIMVDAEGDPCFPEEGIRKQYAINHRKWIDIAAYLGCTSIRTNCRGTQKQSPEEALKWAADAYRMLLEYAEQPGIQVLIENHGGFSNDPEWMTQLFRLVDHPLFGSYPDWRQPGPDFDNVAYLEKMLPYAKGMSYRNQPDDRLTARMIRLSKRLGYSGWYGIESSGREAILKGKELLTQYLNLKSEV